MFSGTSSASRARPCRRGTSSPSRPRRAGAASQPAANSATAWTTRRDLAFGSHGFNRWCHWFDRRGSNAATAFRRSDRTASATGCLSCHDRVERAGLRRARHGLRADSPRRRRGRCTRTRGGTPSGSARSCSAAGARSWPTPACWRARGWPAALGPATRLYRKLNAKMICVSAEQEGADRHEDVHALRPRCRAGRGRSSGRRSAAGGRASR